MPRGVVAAAAAAVLVLVLTAAAAEGSMMKESFFDDTEATAEAVAAVRTRSGWVGPLATPSDLVPVTAPLAGSAQKASECVECDGQVDWSGVYNISAEATCDPRTCCCPYGLAVAYQVGAMVLVATPVTGACAGIPVVAFGAMSQNTNTASVSVLGWKINFSLLPDGDVLITSVDIPTCVGVAQRLNRSTTKPEQEPGADGSEGLGTGTTVTTPKQHADNAGGGDGGTGGIATAVTWAALALAVAAMVAWIGTAAYVSLRRRHADPASKGYEAVEQARPLSEQA